MNTDSLIHEEIDVEQIKSIPQDSGFQETVETKAAEDVELSQEAFNEACTEQSFEAPASEVIEEKQDIHSYLDAESIPETVLMEVVEDIANPSTSEATVSETCQEERNAECETMIEKDIIDQVGQLTRNLHNNLRELGYDKRLESLVAEVPEAQDKLSYVATKTEQAAERTLNATEIAMPIQEKLSSEATQLSQKWKSAFEEQRAQPDTEKFKQLLIDTLSYLDKVPEQTDATNGQLMEIMMAQDFQDLTGQVIKKITAMVHSLEQDLVQLLLANVALEKRHTQPVDSASLMNGPVTNPEKNPETVSSQDQVDDLLASLGF